MGGLVAGVGQQGASGVVILDRKTLFENVAIGARLMEGEVGRENVEGACRAALMHEFVRDLPLGYPWWRCGCRIERWTETTFVDC